MIHNISKSKLVNDAKMRKTVTFLITHIFQRTLSCGWQMHFLEKSRNAKTILRQFNWCIYFFLKVKLAKVTFRCPTVDQTIQHNTDLFIFRFWFPIWNNIIWKHLEATKTVNRIYLENFISDLIVSIAINAMEPIDAFLFDVSRNC